MGPHFKMEYSTFMLVVAIAAVGSANDDIFPEARQAVVGTGTATASRCPAGQEYVACATPCTKWCLFVNSTDAKCECTPGCQCPKDQYLDTLGSGKCVNRSQCLSCTEGGITYPVGVTIVNLIGSPPKESACTCTPKGTWKCGKPCKCHGCGDPHYSTCDGKYFDFQGECSYYVAQGALFSIIVENAYCGKSFASVSCMKNLTINIAPALTVNIDRDLKFYLGNTLATLPYYNPSLFVIANFGQVKAYLLNGIVVTVSSWGFEVFVPPGLTGNLKGLCGVYSFIDSDDFKLSDGFTTTNDPVLFGNSWKVNSSCPDYNATAGSGGTDNPNNNNNQATRMESLTDDQSKKPRVTVVEDPAIAICKVLQKDLFVASCLKSVNLSEHFRRCVMDVNNQNVTSTAIAACNILEKAAGECTKYPTPPLDWRTTVTQCAVKCDSNTTYNLTGDPCNRTCKDINVSTKCAVTYVPGCYCPPGKALDSNQATGVAETCVATKECPCYYKGERIDAGTSTKLSLEGITNPCMCTEGHWVCGGGEKVDGSQHADFRFKTVTPAPASLKSQLNI